MKKKLTLLCASFVILFSACTKSGETPQLSDSNWTFNGVIHFATNSNRLEASGTNAAYVTFSDKNKDRNGTLTVFFKALPRVNASYTIVRSSAALSDTQCAITTSDATGTGFIFSGTTATSVQVSFVDGKIKIDIPSIAMSTAAGSENYTLQGSVYER